MRYHKAIRITRPEADYIISTSTTSLNESVVVEVDGEWYDIRRMTQREVTAFVENLQRERMADIKAGSTTPH
jgi:hypothetical protein